MNGRPDVQRPELYDATSDGGLFLEFIPTYALGMPAGTELEPEPHPESDGPLVRVERKSFLTDDLDKALSALATNLG